MSVSEARNTRRRSRTAQFLKILFQKLGFVFFGNKNLWRQGIFVRVVGSCELFQKLVVFAQAFDPVIVTAQKLSIADFENCKAYKFTFPPVGNVIPVLGSKIFDNVLVLHDCKGPQAVTQSGGFLKIECGGCFLHLRGDFFLSLGALSFEKGFDFFYIDIVGFFFDFVAAGSLASPDVIIHAWSLSLFESAAMTNRVDFV